MLESWHVVVDGTSMKTTVPVRVAGHDVWYVDGLALCATAFMRAICVVVIAGGVAASRTIVAGRT